MESVKDQKLPFNQLMSPLLSETYILQKMPKIHLIVKFKLLLNLLNALSTLFF